MLSPKSMLTNWQELKPSVVFHCPDIEATCRRLEANGVHTTMPPTPMGGGMFAKFTALDGNEFGLTGQQIARSGEALAGI